MATITGKGKAVKAAAGGIIDLAADGISLADYLRAVHGIADAINDIRDDPAHNWCWVWIKFAACLNPLITQGERSPMRDNTWRVKVLEPRPEDRYPKEWFTEAGWNTYDKVNQDGERMKELRKTYGRILQIVADGHITMEEAQKVFKRAHLPAYGEVKRKWTGQIQVYETREVTVPDIAATREVFEAAWKEFLAKVGWEDGGGRRAPLDFQPYRQEQIQIPEKDKVELIGNPNRNYDPMVLPDGRRLAN